MAKKMLLIRAAGCTSFMWTTMWELLISKQFLGRTSLLHFFFVIFLLFWIFWHKLLFLLPCRHLTSVFMPLRRLLVLFLFVCFYPSSDESETLWRLHPADGATDDLCICTICTWLRSFSFVS
jgi:hypothetical protein